MSEMNLPLGRGSQPAHGTTVANPPGSVAVCPRSALPLILSLCVACGGDKSATQTQSTWITEAEYQFGDAPERDVFFSRPFVRADPARDRVFVVDQGASQVSVWSQGSLRFILGGRGEGPGEFISPADLYFEADGTMSVVESSGSRFSYFTAEGERIRTLQGPGTSLSYQGFRVTLTPPKDDASVGVPSIPLHIEVGTNGVRSMHRQPLLRVGRSDSGQWHDPEPLLWLDLSNRALATQFPDGGTSYGAQPFGDADQFRLRPGAAVVMRQKGAPGAVELIEVNGAGDTVWHRRLQFEPRKLTPRMVEEVVEGIVDILAEPNSSRISRQGLRDAYNEAIYKPEYVPAAEGIVLTASGEAWLRTTEVSDTLRTHSVVPRGDLDGGPRRVLLPESIRVSDATATHVWGVWWDSLDVPHIVGRRLVLLGEEGSR